VNSSHHGPPGRPGSLPLTEKRDEYLRLMNQGMGNAEACRIVGIMPGTGVYWRYGRTVKSSNGSIRYYPPIKPSAQISERYLSHDERVTIADRHRERIGPRAIAAELGRSPSTISREIRRNQDPETGKYDPWRAQKRAADRRPRPKITKLASHEPLLKFVQSRLDEYWSPEQISRHLPKDFPALPDMRICHETIYQAIYSAKDALGRGFPKKALRSGRLRRKRRRRADQRTTYFVQQGRSISQRPIEALARAIPGHWEGDLITGRFNGSAIGTLVERSTRFAMLVHLPDGHNSEQVRDALIAAFRRLPVHLAKSLAWDQGGEMSRHDEFTSATDVPVFFCQAGKPWQRGSNENLNGLLRQYFPKGSDLTIHTAADLAAVANQLNRRPRKCLDWSTPLDRFQRLS
jgi:IS30 family transposase